jgi:pre-mRNA-splicing factor ATP-dependent RNA helicase DHX15/PRP43
LSKSLDANDHEILTELNMSYKKLILAERQMSSQLPVLNRKREIFNMLNKNNLIIIEGETGSGKSTQLPQMLCEYFQVF